MSKSIDKEAILEAHQNRFACKSFDPNRPLPQDDLEFIMEIARLSPSSIGLEPWKFIVVTDPIVKAKLKPLCWDQKQITDASAVVFILTRTKESIIDDGYMKEHFEKRGLNPDWYLNFLNGMSDPLNWTKKQAYIALANIMSSAKMIGIDSCAIEGFDSSTAVTQALGFDTKEFDTAVIAALGYNIGELRPKMRLSKEEVVTYI